MSIVDNVYAFLRILRLLLVLPPTCFAIPGPWVLLIFKEIDQGILVSGSLAVARLSRGTNDHMRRIGIIRDDQCNVVRLRHRVAADFPLFLFILLLRLGLQPQELLTECSGFRLRSLLLLPLSHLLLLPLVPNPRRGAARQ